LSIEKSQAKRITAGLLIGLVLSSLDQTIVAAAMPTIVQELGGLSLYSWVFSVYMLASTAAMPIYGKIADLFGRKRIFLIGLLLFLAGSLLCGLAGSMMELVVFRGVQGLGAGALMPIAFTIIADLYPPEQRVKLMGLFSTVFAASTICGPAIGGLLVGWNWSWIFLINIPFGAAAILILALSLEEKRDTVGKRHIDWFGAVTLTGAIVALLLALVMGGNEYAWDSAAITGLFAAGALLLGIFIWAETRAREPIIPLRLFAIRTISLSNIAGFFVSAGMFGAIAYLPLFVQGVIGVSSSMTGYILTPFMLATVVTTMGCRRWMTKVSYRAILVPSLALTLAGFLLFSQMSLDTSRFEIVIYMIVAGLGMGAVFPTLGTAAQHAVDWHQRGVATSSNQFFRSIGGTLGVSVLGGLMTRSMDSGLQQSGAPSSESLHGLTNPQSLLDQGLRSSLTAADFKVLQAVFSHALSEVFLIAALFVFVSLLAGAALGSAKLAQAAK